MGIREHFPLGSIIQNLIKAIGNMKIDVCKVSFLSSKFIYI